MKINNMKRFIYASVAVLMLFIVSCETEMVEPIDPFSLKQGGYMRTVTPFPIPIFSVSRANMSGTRMQMVLEAVTPNFGANFDTYELVIRFVDNTPTNGSNSITTDAPLLILRSTDYKKDTLSGYPRTTLTVTGKQMQDALKLTDAQIATGDQFQIRGKMKLLNGMVFDATNSSGDIVGGAFYSSPFLYRANVID